MAMPASIDTSRSPRDEHFNVVLLREDAARARTDSPEFIARWYTLHAEADSVTVFQSPAYVCTWYRIYAPEWEPVLALAESDDGQMLGLWPLALQRRTGELMCAGAHQAEYQTWLARPQHGAAFVAATWPLLCQTLNVDRLRLKYLPSLALLNAISSDPTLATQLQVRQHARPLMRLDAEELRSSMAKKANKSRFNRLKRLGTLEFKRLSDSAELELLLDQLISCYDLRQGAVNQSTPFRDDPYKREFHRALFSQGSPSCYVTVSLLDGQPVAAFWGASSGTRTHLGMLIHSPMLAEHSPGKLHLMQLGQQLMADGFDVLDLTPGGDAWKERFANDHDEVAELTLFRDSHAASRAQRQEDRLAWIKQTLLRVGLTPAHLRKLRARLAKLSLDAVTRRVSKWLTLQRELRIYRADRSIAQGKQTSPQVQCNALQALLAFEPSESWQTRDAFLSSALDRLERGERAYTICVDGRLAHCGWLVPRQTHSTMSEVGQSMTFPAHSSTLYDFYTHPDFRGRGLYRINLDHMLVDAFADPETEYAYISVLADNLPSRRVIERTGFVYQTSYFWQRRFGRDRRYPLHPDTPPATHEAQP